MKLFKFIGNIILFIITLLLFVFAGYGIWMFIENEPYKDWNFEKTSTQVISMDEASDSISFEYK